MRDAFAYATRNAAHLTFAFDESGVTHELVRETPHKHERGAFGSPRVPTADRHARATRVRGIVGPAGATVDSHVDQPFWIRRVCHRVTDPTGVLTLAKVGDGCMDGGQVFTTSVRRPKITASVAAILCNSLASSPSRLAFAMSTTTAPSSLPAA